MKYILFTWLGFIPIAFLNGGLRELVYKKYVGELTAHQISTFIGISLFLAYGLLIRRWLPLETTRDALVCSVTWVVLMLTFEFGFGYFVGKHSWAEMLHDYNLAAGRVWLLVVLFVAALPFILREV